MYISLYLHIHVCIIQDVNTKCVWNACVSNICTYTHKFIYGMTHVCWNDLTFDLTFDLTLVICTIRLRSPQDSPTQPHIPTNTDTEAEAGTNTHTNIDTNVDTNTDTDTSMLLKRARVASSSQENDAQKVLEACWVLVAVHLAVQHCAHVSEINWG